MRAITIYMEGGSGGDSSSGRAELRRGMDKFLRAVKDQARDKRWQWKLVACGTRVQARKAFDNACANEPGSHVFLLVDSEGPVTAGPRQHLRRRDGWEFPDVGDDALQLMTQFMETWLVADPDALSDYYGQGFKPKALPASRDLETVDKKTIEAALTRATKSTTKGEYHKIKHASDLLERIDPQKVKARCRHCRRLFEQLESVLKEA